MKPHINKALFYIPIFLFDFENLNKNLTNKKSNILEMMTVRMMYVEIEVLR
jgi:hypothetical protein